MKEWLWSNGVTHVAMESTGVYWKPISFNGKVVEVQQDGWSAILRYDLENPVSGGVVSAECVDTWVHSFQTDEAGVIKFTVDPNPDEGTRDTKVKVSYSVGKLGFEATIRQSSTGPVQDQFIITIREELQSGARFTVTPVDNSMNIPILVRVAKGSDTAQDGHRPKTLELRHGVERMLNRLYEIDSTFIFKKGEELQEFMKRNLHIIKEESESI